MCVCFMPMFKPGSLFYIRCSCLTFIFMHLEIYTIYLLSCKGQPSDIRFVIIVHRHASSTCILKNKKSHIFQNSIDTNKYLYRNLKSIINYTIVQCKLTFEALCSAIVCMLGSVTAVSHPHPLTKRRTLSASFS